MSDKFLTDDLDYGPSKNLYFVDSWYLHAATGFIEAVITRVEWLEICM